MTRFKLKPKRILYLRSLWRVVIAVVTIAIVVKTTPINRKLCRDLGSLFYVQFSTQTACQSSIYIYMHIHNTPQGFGICNFPCTFPILNVRQKETSIARCTQILFACPFSVWRFQRQRGSLISHSGVISFNVSRPSHSRHCNSRSSIIAARLQSDNKVHEVIKKVRPFYIILSECICEI